MWKERGEAFVNIHTHRREGEIYILDISDGKESREGELCSYGLHPLYIRGEEQSYNWKFLPGKVELLL